MLMPSKSDISRRWRQPAIYLLCVCRAVSRVPLLWGESGACGEFLDIYGTALLHRYEVHTRQTTDDHDARFTTNRPV